MKGLHSKRGRSPCIFQVVASPLSIRRFLVIGIRDRSLFMSGGGGHCGETFSWPNSLLI